MAKVSNACSQCILLAWRKSRSTSKKSASSTGSVRPLLKGAPNSVVRNVVGGVISPLFANVYLDKLDTFVEETLYPQFNRGTGRRGNPEYKAVVRRMAQAKASGDMASWARLRQAAKDNRPVAGVL